MRVVALLEDDRAGRVVAALDVTVREVPVDLDPDRGQVGLALHGQTGIRPRAETALEDPDTAPSLAAQEPGGLSARSLFRTRAERDDELVLLDRQVDLPLGDVLGIEADRHGNRERSGRVVGGDAHIEKHGIQPALQEVDDLARTDSMPIALASSDSAYAPRADA